MAGAVNMLLRRKSHFQIGNFHFCLGNRGRVGRNEHYDTGRVVI